LAGAALVSSLSARERARAEHILKGYDMRNTMMVLVSGMLAASLLAGCNDDSTPTSPSSGSPTSPPTSGGGTSGGGTAGGTGGGTAGGAAPATAAVAVGDIFFKSGLNGSSNPAVDTVAVNGTVTWTWATTENLPHSVQSIGSPSFTSSAIQSGSGKTYQFMFTAPGTYQYDCAVHGQMMTGMIVVQAAAGTPSMTPATPPSTPATPSPGY
jgi:plastocyanin